jgi:hypothetical protein
VDLAILLAALTLGAGDSQRMSVDDAEVLLREAPAFRDVAVGEAGTTPPEVRAFRKVLASPDGVRRFQRLVAAARPAGQLYALCGLFFLDPPAFDVELVRLERQDAKITEQQGCIVFDSSQSSVLASAPGAPRMSHSANFRDWLRNGFGGPVHDVAGGSTCYRLRFGSSVPARWLRDPSKAPEDGPNVDHDP